MRSILFYSVFISVYLSFHDFHVSVTDMEHNANNKSVEISHRLFIDDLENALKKFHKTEDIDTYNPSDPYKLDSLIGEYLKAKVFVNIDGKDSKFNYLGSEVESDARWCYYEILEVESVSSVEVTNVALMDIFEDQQNIIHFKFNNKTKSYKLDRDTKSTTFKF